MKDDSIADAVEPSLPDEAEPIPGLHENDVSRHLAADIRKNARRAQIAGVALIALAALALTLEGVGIYRLGKTNRRGVERIVDCTTPGRPCFEEQASRSDFTVADALLQLNQSHLVLECLLKVPVEERTGVAPRCQQVGADETARLRAELVKKLAEAHSTTVTTKGGP